MEKHGSLIYGTEDEIMEAIYERELRNTSINDVSLADYVKENYVPMSVIEDIKQEIVAYKDDKVIHAERNEMIDIMLEIINKHTK